MLLIVFICILLYETEQYLELIKSWSFVKYVINSAYK